MTVSWPARPKSDEWVYAWHDDALNMPRDKLDGVMYDLVMKYRTRKSLAFDEAACHADTSAQAQC